MAHEIHEHDSLMLYKNEAWHGLGKIVEDAQNPLQALETADLNWLVKFPWKQSAIFNMADGLEYPIKEYRSLFRMDKGIEVGSHKARYTPVQNHELAELAWQFGGDKLVVESAGSLFNGRKVWFLLKSEGIELENDKIQPYFMLLNSHDGSTCLTGKFTTIRAVCNNTVSAIENEAGKAWKMLHTKSIKDNMDQIGDVVKGFFAESESMTQGIATIARKQPRSEQRIAEFWKDCYVSLFGVPKDNEAEVKAQQRLMAWKKIMDAEMETLKVETPDFWLMANAVTNNIQHQAPSVKRNGWQERRIESNMFGENEKNTNKIMKMALEAVA